MTIFEIRWNLIDISLGLHDFLPVEEQRWFLQYLNNLKSSTSALFSSDESLRSVDTL